MVVIIGSVSFNARCFSLKTNSVLLMMMCLFRTTVFREPAGHMTSVLTITEISASGFKQQYLMKQVLYIF